MLESPTARLIGRPDRARNEPPRPWSLADLEALHRSMLEVVQPTTGAVCRCGCGRQVNVGDLYAGEGCKEAVDAAS